MTTSTRVVRKSLACEEDLLLGKGTVTQTRNGVDYPLNKLTLIKPVDTIAERDALDTSLYLYCTVAGVPYSWTGTAWENTTWTDLFQPYPTVAAAKAATLVAGISVSTQGYSTAGVGSATYLVKTVAAYGGTPDGYGDHATDDGDFVLVLQSLVIDAAQFGAVSGVDSTLAIQAMFTAVTTAMTINKTYLISSPLSMPNQGVILAGAGALHATTGLENDYIIEVDADDVQIVGLTFDNPSLFKPQTGGRQGAVRVNADNVSVNGNYIYRCLTGIATESTNERFGTTVIGNHLLDMLGAGGGIGSASTYGEDRGDGIIIWGANSTIANNIVELRAGEDGRVGVHAEGLPGGQADPDHRDIVFSGNQVRGAYRRHFVTENINRGSMIGNISRGGATWWSFAIIQCEDITLTGNIAYWDRTSASDQGNTWSPKRGVFGLINFNDNITIDNSNIVRMTADSDGYLLATEPTTLTQTNIKIGVQAQSLNTTKNRGLDITGLTNPTIDGANLIGFSSGVKSYRNPGGFTVKNSEFKGCDENITGEFNAAAAVKLKNNDFLGAALDSVKVSGADVDFVISGNTSESITDQDYDLFSLASLHFTGNANLDGTGIVRLLGSTSGSFSTADAVTYDYSSNSGYTSNWQHNTADLLSVTAAVNTTGKTVGRQVVASGDIYISQGNAAASIWANMNDSTTLTPV